MDQTTTRHSVEKTHARSHMPAGSVFFERIVPVLLVLLGLVMLALVLFAASVLLGLVQF